MTHLTKLANAVRRPALAPWQRKIKGRPATVTRYPFRKGKRMTIAAGFLCSDGVLLSVDSQFTGAGMKTHGQKLFNLELGHGCTGTLAGAGNLTLMRKSVAGIKDACEGKSDIPDITACMERVLGEIFSRHVDTVPLDQRADFDVRFLLAIWNKERGPRLFASERNALCEVRHHECIGTGGYIAEYVISLLMNPSSPTLEEAKLVAVQAVRVAREYDVNSGGHTFLRPITDQGELLQVKQSEVAEAENAFTDVLDWFQNLIPCLDPETKEAMIDVSLQAIRESIIEFRGKQIERQESAESIRRKKQRT